MEKDISDIIVEALEVFINHILYIRDIYPGQIFKKRRIYNTPVHMSIYPPLNTYLHEVLKASREFLKAGQFQCAELLVYEDNRKEYERYNFKVAVGKNFKEEDAFLLDFEEQLRSSLLLLAERLKGLKKLSSEAKFKVLLHTTQSAFVKLTHDSHYQNFPWLRAILKPALDHEHISLLPLTQIGCINLSINADIF